jgi:hypothetical protein
LAVGITGHKFGRGPSKDTKLWWNGPWMAPFQICVRWSRLPS